VQRLEPPDTHYFSAALGWLELGNRTEAKEELAQISQAQMTHPGVLELRWAICAEEKNWQEGLEVARAQVQNDPKSASGWLHQAYALRRVPGGGLRQAWDALLPAFEQFSNEILIPYNLACYACQMEKLDTARVWLKRALLMEKKESVKAMALKDPDLTPLWEEIREW
jgi:tetratricopeptide (TPR) repeat protein